MLTTQSTLIPLSASDPNKTGCNLIPSMNTTTVALFANWENIPETLLLNASIGFILFLMFVVLTKIAWFKQSTSGSVENDNILTFLYGYRDPERWYVIPRFEFLRRFSKHHEHDLHCSRLYVPPKLPLANPIELLAYESDVGDETESAESVKEDDEDNMVSKTMKSIRGAKALKMKGEHQKQRAAPKDLIDIESRPQATKSPPDKQATGAKSVIPGATTTTSTKIPPLTAQQQVGGGGGGSSGTVAKIAKFKSTLAGAAEKSLFRGASTSPAPLSGSFFYPSILTAEQLQASNMARRLNRFFGLFFRVTDADIIYAKGLDAYEYLLFQRHLIFIMLVANIFCLGIILPVHWFFGQSAREFQRTTIKSLSFNSSYYWAHIVSSVLIVIFTIIILNSYRDSIVTKNETQLARKTLLIGNIPTYQRTRVKLCEIFREYFPRCDVKSIQFVYDTERLEYYQLQLDSIMAAKEYCIYYKQKYNKELMVKQTDVNEGQYCNGNCRFCSFLLVCCCYWPMETKQAGSVFYSQQERRYRDKIKRDCEKLIQKPSEYAFVTLKSNRQARRMMQEITRLKSEVMRERYAIMWDKSRAISPNWRTGSAKNSATSAPRQSEKNSPRFQSIGRDFFISDNNSANDPLDPNNNPHVRSIRSPIAISGNGYDGATTTTTAAPAAATVTTDDRSPDLERLPPPLENLDGPLAWSVRYAPHPDNVEYHDILELAKSNKYTEAFLHVLMIIIFIFFTTPNVLLSAIERWSVLQPEATKKMTGFQGLFINYVSVLLQIIATTILPYLIVLISKQIPYEDTSSKNHTIMWKTYLFLVLMVIVMPSIGMNSAQALLSSEISPKCLFPTDNGAYFLNYVLTSIFLSSVMELVKPIDIIFYYFILWTGRSRAEFEGGRQYIEREFSVSMQHTSVLLVFSVVMTYMISCPLIAPAGLLYLIVKHAIDHYHLFYTYFTKKVDKNLQRTIEIFVRVALLMMLFQTTVALYISTGASYFSLISQIVFWLTLAIFLMNCCFDCTSRQMSASAANSGSNLRTRQHHRDFCACFYLPRVMGDLLRNNAIPESCISRKV